MKLIIAGGRDYHFTEEDYAWLNQFLPYVTEVVSGGALGADRCGEIWARRYGIPVKRMKPDWKKYGRAAGFIRNGSMALYTSSGDGGAVALFPGGAGTRNMFEQAKKAGLKVYNRLKLGD